MNYLYRQLRRLQNSVRFGMRPWMSRSEYRLILQYLEPHHSLFEWGAGFSTLFFAPHVRQVHSVEHNASWYRNVQDALENQQQANVELQLVPADEPLSGLPNARRTGNARSRQFASYIHNIGMRDQTAFDRILIDGRSRPECAREALGYLHDESLVFIHDFFNTSYDRSSYHAAIFEDYASVAAVEEGQSLVVLRPRQH